MKRLIILFCFVLLLVSCRTVKHGTATELPQIVHDTVYHTSIRHDTLRVVQHYRDTIIQRDSVYADGQTVYKYKYIYKTRTAHDTVQVYRVLKDTVYVHRQDSVSIPVYVDREVKVKYTPWYKNAMAAFGCLFLITILFCLLILFVKRKSG